MGALFGFTGMPDPHAARAMSESLTHRGPRASRLIQTQNVTLGFRQQFDESDEQKFRCGLIEHKEHALVVAGIIRNPSPKDYDLNAILDAATENLADLRTYLRGQFTLAYATPQSLHLIRDPAGERTIFYGIHNDRLYFATEPKAILAVPGFPRRLRPAGVAQYLTFSFQPGAATMLEDIHELPAGHHLEYNGANYQTTRYFIPEQFISEEEKTDYDWVAHFKSQFKTAVAERFHDPQRVGVFLSGGIDSSAVAAEVAQQSNTPVRTYAIHFGKNYPNELEFARMVAHQCHTDHEEVLIQPKGFLPRLRNIIWHLDDPIGDPVTVPNFELAQHVSNEMAFVFNGEGGDPCFGGPKNIPMLLHHWYGAHREPRFREKRYLASYQRSYQDLSRILTPEFLQHIDEERDLESILTPFFNTTQPNTFLEKLIAINIRLKGAHLILPKVERMTGAFGITPLAPLFDDRLVRLAFEMPARMKLHRGVEKVVIKRAYANHLPKPIIDRPKSGMRVPVHFWFQREMRRYAKKILNRRTIESEGIWRWDRVKQLLDYDTEEGPGRYGLRLWMLLTFEIWRRIVIDGEPV